MKKLFTVFLALTLVFCVFAETTQVKPVLTEKDVSSFVKNFSKIRSELEKLEVDIEDAQGLMAATAVAGKAQGILNKYGLTGENAFDKLRAIAYAYALESYDLALKADPQTAQMLKSLNMDPMAEVRNLVAPSDCEIVKKYFNDLVEVFDN